DGEGGFTWLDRARADQQALDAAGARKRSHRGVAGPAQEQAVGIDQLVEPIDQYPDREPVEQRADCAGGRRGRGLRLGRPRGNSPAAIGIAAWIGSGLSRRGLRLELHRRRARWHMDGGALRQGIEARELAAYAKPAITTKTPLAIKYRQARHLDRKAGAIVVDRPADREPAEGVPRCERMCDLVVRVEAKRGGKHLPASPEHRVRTRERREFLGVEGEASIGIDLPDEPQRLMALRRSGRG